MKHVAKPEPLRKKSCGRAKCFPCTTGGGKCEKNEEGYKMVCLTCLRDGKCTEYEGETGRNGFNRGIEDGENALWKHYQVDHESIRAEFSMKVLNVHRTALVR